MASPVPFKPRLDAPWAEVVELRLAPAIAALLQRAASDGRPLILSSGEQPLGDTRLLAYDALHRRLSLDIRPIAARLPALLEATDVLATSYMLGAQLQFELRRLRVARGAENDTLQAAQPQCILRINRRRSPRLRLAGSPVAWLHAPAAADATPPLKLLDLSAQGCALLWSGSEPPPRAGTVFPHAWLELDADTRLELGLELMHATPLHDGGGPGLRLGLRITGLDLEAAALLRRLLGQTPGA